MENISKWRIDTELFWFQVFEKPAGMFNARYWPARTDNWSNDLIGTILSGDCFRIEALRFTAFAALDHARRDAENYVRHDWEPPRSEMGKWC